MLTIEQQTKPIEAETDTEGDGGLLFNQIWIVSLEINQSVDDAGDCAPKRDIPYSRFSSKGLWIFLPPSGKYDKVIHFCLFYVHVFLVTLPLHPAT